MEFLKIYSVALTIFLGIDAIWLTVVAKDFYAKHLGFIMTDKPNLIAALVFYLINIVGITLLVIMPSLQEKTVTKVLLLSALYGLCTYATYDLTNMATLKNWPTIVTVVDLIWGVTLSVVVGVGTFLFVKRFL